MDKIKLAAVQMISGYDYPSNWARMQALVEEAAAKGAELVVLPEYWPIFGRTDQDKLALAEPFGSGPIQSALSQLAQRLGIVLMAGSIPLQSKSSAHVLNTLLTYDASGALVGRYDKVHLFGFSGLGERYDEADSILPGTKTPELSLFEGQLKVAQGICYDLRFPEFFRVQAPFDLLVLPAAFTYTTGKAHWEILLRARAIENQCYLLASAQGGTHQNGRRTFGHSMLIDPWGEVIDLLPEGEGLVMGVLSMKQLHSIRTRLPALKHQTLSLASLK